MEHQHLDPRCMICQALLEQALPVLTEGPRQIEALDARLRAIERRLGIRPDWETYPRTGWGP